MVHGIALKNIYTKPLTVTINIDLEGENDEEIYVAESDNGVSIAMNVGADIGDYWNNLGNPGAVEAYIDLDNMHWPSTAANEITSGTYTFTILPGRKEVDGSYAGSPLYQIIGRHSGKENISYLVRYVRKPKPIILVNLSDVNEGLSIDGYSEVTECELPEEMHTEILQRAVELAKATQSGDLQNITAMGQRSE